MSEKIKIISMENEEFFFNKRILNFAEGLELFKCDEEIVFTEIVTSSFLKLMQDFYEKNDFDVKKLEVKPKISSKKFEENLNIGSEINAELIKPFY
jgi:hypothetical protein